MIEQDSETPKIVFRNQKKKRGVKWKVDTNQTVSLETSFVNKTYGIRLPNALFNFFEKPQDNTLCQVTISIKSAGKKQSFNKITARLSNRTDAYVGKKNKCSYIESVFLKPTLVAFHNRIKDSIARGEKIVVSLGRVFKAKNQLIRMVALREQVPHTRMLAVDAELLVCGGLQQSSFEIYCDRKNRLYIKSETIVYQTGKIVLSTDLEKIIPNIFGLDFVICSKDNEVPLVIPMVYRKRKDGRRVAELNYPHFTKKKQKAAICFTHPELVLSSSIKEDLKLKKKLEKLGFTVRSLHSNFIPGNHWNESIESQMKTMVRQAFQNTNSTIRSEVQIITGSDENELGDKHILDEIVLTEENRLLHIEYKTSFSTTKHTEIDRALAELFHIKRKVGGNLIQILIIYEDLFAGTKNITKNFGLKNDIILIGKQELAQLFQKPALLQKRITNFEKRKNNKQIPPVANKTTAPLSILEKSIQKLTTNKIVQNNKSTILHKIPSDFKMKIIPLVHEGSEFENEVRLLLSAEGFEVLSNVFFLYYGRRMELDHVCFKNQELVLVSCRDASRVNCQMSFKLDIKQKVCKLAHRKYLLGADRAQLYLKVRPSIYSKVRAFEGAWVQGVEIIFKLSKSTQYSSKRKKI